MRAWGLLLLVAATAQVTAQTNTQDALTLQFEKTSIQLGRQLSARVIEVPFKFRVADGAKVEIKDLRPSCGCLKTRLSAKDLTAGAKGEILLAIHGFSQTPGPHRYNVTVSYTDPQPRSVTLSADVDLYSDVTIEPNNLLASVDGAGELRRTLTVKDTRPSPLTIVKVETTGTLVRAKLMESPTVGQHRIAVVVDGAVDVGRYDEKIQIHTNDSTYRILEIPVTIVRQARVRCFPEFLRFSASSSTADRLSRQVLLRDQKGEDIRISEVTADLEGLSIDWDQSPGLRPAIRVVCDRAKVTKQTETVLRVQLVEPETSVLEIPVKID